MPKPDRCGEHDSLEPVAFRPVPFRMGRRTGASARHPQLLFTALAAAAQPHSPHVRTLDQDDMGAHLKELPAMQATAAAASDTHHRRSE
jgi:hypothetical protein